MASFRSLATNNASATEIAIDAPSGIEDGDLLLCNLLVRAGDVTITPPSGWTELVSRYINDGDFMDTAILYKIANSESGSYTFARVISLRDSGVITAWSGVNGTTPIDSYSNTSYITNDTTLRFGSVTTSAATQTVVLFGDIALNPPPTVTTPTDWTERVSYLGNRARIVVYSREYATAGSTGDIDATMAGSLLTKHGYATVLGNVSASGGLPRRALSGPFYGSLRGSIS
jgi:hypothetical protein